MKRLAGFAGSLMLAASAATLPSRVGAEDIVIHMAAPDWPPTRFMQEEANRSYKAPSGNAVKLEIDFIPWPNFYERVAASLTSGEQKYQMIVTDSQWLGSFIEGGYYLKLNDYIDADPALQALMKDLHPALVEAYSTYPHKSKNYYGFPQMPDTYMTWFRNDLFCHEGERKDFMAKFGEALPCSYEEWQTATWNTWENIGKFFRRQKGDKLGDGIAEDNFYGIAYQAGKGYDFSSMQINAFFWQGGGDIWDETKEPHGQALGVVNSDENVAAFERYLALLEYAPPAHKTGQMDIFQIQELFMQGKVAAIIDWAGLAEPVLDPNTSKIHDRVGFALAPHTPGPGGKALRYQNIGGQPFVLTTWNDDKVVKEALDIVKWWLSTDVQIEFAKNGGQSGLQSVMSSPGYNDYRPWNRAHVANLPHQRDVWHVPEFFELLTQQQEEFDKAVTGQKSAKEALDAIAKFQDELLRDADRIK